MPLRQKLWKLLLTDGNRLTDRMRRRRQTYEYSKVPIRSVKLLLIAGSADFDVSVDENQRLFSVAQMRVQINTVAGNTVSAFTRSKSLRKDSSHPISSQGREIILQCFENPHSEFGNKVLQRIFEKRVDYQKYVYAMGKDRAYQMSVRLKDLVEEAVAKIYDPDYICEISRTYGEEHVELKAYGFKPDFWVTIADAITVEGVILDMASHQPADTVAAWSQLVTMMFSAVRDGYYSALRRHRMSSKRCLQRQATQESRDSESTVDVVSNHSETSESHRPTTRSVSMYARTSQNGTTTSRTSGCVNVMAPVSNRDRSTLVETRNSGGSMRVSKTQERMDIISDTTASSGTSSNRPRPIFE
ncbi:hypothetical protein KIN20_025296 [Parelaphostrongylus tenuis]|uniref:Uncharacterized protein n=1 Tax=Parelaphostrongylus tenuis TaxID=148309 RepID=A0AAD5NBS2_PARTN|nr:hypothetical protein KIN20_025296 [Parelaphostrongylus tenuis]